MTTPPQLTSGASQNAAFSSCSEIDSGTDSGITARRVTNHAAPVAAAATSPRSVTGDRYQPLTSAPPSTSAATASTTPSAYTSGSG
jgi:hypothetical protein